MTETTFRAKPAAVKPEVRPEGKEPTRGDEVTEEVPYLDYEREHNHPHSVDYFKLGDTWEDHAGGFPEEISIIESYLEDRIKKGEVANSVTAVQEELKKLEKVNNLSKEERAVVKIGVLTAYVEFLMKTDKIKVNLRKYGSH